MDSAQLYYKANDLLQSGKFKQAQQIYQQLLQQQGDNGTVHYNLGIAYFRDNQLGKSIFHFRKAKLLSPRDGDIGFNLEFARKQSKDKIEVKSAPFMNYVDNNYPMNAKESTYMMSGSLMLWAVLAIIALYKHSEILRWSHRIVMIVFMLFALGTCHKVYNVEHFGVVVANKANIYSGGGTSNVLLFNLHQGAEFVIKREQDDWLRIELADGKKGWISKKHVIY